MFGGGGGSALPMKEWIDVHKPRGGLGFIMTRNFKRK